MALDPSGCGPPRARNDSHSRVFSARLLDLSTKPFSKIVANWRTGNLGLQARAKKVGNARLHDGTWPVALHAFSPSVVPQPADWPEAATVCGYWFLDQDASWTPPRELKAFINTGEAPIAIGFGSLVVDDPGALAAKMLSGIRAESLALHTHGGRHPPRGSGHHRCGSPGRSPDNRDARHGRPDILGGNGWRQLVQARNRYPQRRSPVRLAVQSGRRTGLPLRLLPSSPSITTSPADSL